MNSNHSAERTHPLAVVRYAQSTATVTISWQSALNSRWHCPSFEHMLERKPSTDGKTWQCSICARSWKSKPKTKCVGVLSSTSLSNSQQHELLTLASAARQNLKLKPDSRTVAYLASAGALNPETQLFFQRDRFDIAEPWLPPIVERPRTASLKTIEQLRLLDLRPTVGSIPKACYPIPSYSNTTVRFCLLYDVAECVAGYESAYITKTRLLKTYHLSESWLLALGSPDVTQPNPHYENAAPMQLYLRDRVEAFLADRADEYAVWLEERDKRVAIARVISAKAKQKRTLVREQTQKCLTCASAWVRDGGFWCAIYPTGWSEGVPEALFCPDWQARPR